MSRISPVRLFLLIVALVFSLAACSSDDDSTADGSPDGETDAGLPVDDPPADDTPADDPPVDDGDSAAAAGGGATRPWIGGEWDLQSMTVDGVAVEIPATAEVNLNISGPDSLSGNAGCNLINATILAPLDDDRDGGTLTIAEMAMTERGCDILDFEAQYVDALIAASEWELTPPSGLVFRGDGVELVYGIGAPPAEVAFENTEWLFDTIFDGEGVERTASSTRADKPQVTAVFSTGQAALTSEDCGTVVIGARYEAGGNDGPISFEEVEEAFVACEDPESNMLLAVQGLADATGFQIFDGRLTFIGLPGETVSFIAADG